MAVLRRVEWWLQPLLQVIDEANAAQALDPSGE